MQDQNLSMLETDLTQRLMNRRRIVFGKRRLLGLLKLLELNLLGLLPRIVLADSIHCDSMRDRVQPRPQRTGVFQLVYAANRPDPHILKNVEPAVRIAGQAGRVVEQRPFHDRDKVFESAWLASLATECDPLIPDSILRFHLHLQPMSKQ